MGEEAKAMDTPPTIGASVIPIMNKLQDILAPVGAELSKISLPQVAVVGSQSSGKSSVLEALVGRDFLPRGCDICTRRPLVLMLENRPRNAADDDDDGAEWGEFRHLPGKRFYDFSRIRREIQAETEREAGQNRGVSDRQISMRISSPNVLNMTLVDLPGVTKVPVGDQPTDIEERIRKMIMAHIRRENCIILAVTPANSDLATSDALQMAREADPTGSRTIGVITKLDIMDRGTDARNFLLGKVVPLRLGYVGVVNRSQEDINKNRSIAEALAYEEQFFHDHPVYSGLSDRCGIPQLAKKLNQILEQHIRMVLPGLNAELNSHMMTIVKELRMYGEAIESKGEQGVILLNILTQYCEGEISLSCYSFCPGWESIDHLLLQCSMATNIWSFAFTLFRLAWVMLKSVLDLLECWEGIVLRGIVKKCFNSFYFFPGFWQGNRPPSNNERPVSSGGNTATRTWGISSIFGSRSSPGESQASRSLGETAHHVEQMPSIIQLREPPSILRPLEMTEHEAIVITVTKLLLRSYYDIVRKNIQDLVPKAVMHFLVNHTKRELHSIFIQKLYRESLFEELLQEQEELAVKRKQMREMYLVLQRAIQTLEEVESVVLPQNSNLRGGTDTTTGLPRIPGFSSPLPSANYNDSRSSYISSFTNSKATRLFHSEEHSMSINSNGL
ncbi:dynamin-related protein 3B [Quercus suber]|uniref:dynamin-related protein 3B n=1 Tax=Quercus suber TaxID=58331 RepID=UPI0032DF50DF